MAATSGERPSKTGGVLAARGTQQPRSGRQGGLDPRGPQELRASRVKRVVAAVLPRRVQRAVAVLIIVAFFVAPLGSLLTAGRAVAPADPVPDAVTPGSLEVVLDPADFTDGDGQPLKQATIEALTAGTRGVTYLGISVDDGGSGPQGQLWFAREGREGAKRLELDQDPGVITALLSIDLPPSADDYVDGATLAQADARDGLVIAGTAGVFFAEVQLPLGAGATGRVTLSEMRQEGVDQSIRPTDMAEGARGSLFLTGPGGSGALSELVSEPEGGGYVYKELRSSILDTSLALADPAGASILESGAPVTVSGIRQVAASHAGDLVVLDQDGRRLVRVDGGVTSDLYSLPNGRGEIRDMVFDELGSLYWTSPEGIYRLDVTGQVELLVPGTGSSEAMASTYRIADPGVTTLSAQGALLVASASALEVTTVRSVANLDSAVTQQLDLSAWVAGRPLGLSVSRYCACQDAVTDDAFFKLKVGVDASGVPDEVVLDADRFFLLGLVEGAPNLRYEIPEPATGAQEVLEEVWSGRTLTIAAGADLAEPQALTTFDIADKTFGLYAFPASPLDVVFRSGEQIGFASELTGGAVAPGSTYYDERDGYGSLVFTAPRQSASGERVRVLPVGLGYWDGSQWRGLVEIGSWGAPGIPWMF
jgi:hypothetical protein